MKKLIALIIILSISLTNLAVSHAAITNPELKTSVVQIWSQESDGSWYKGSGVNISVDALILTAAHVVIDSTTNQPSEHLNICITYNEYTPPSCEYSAIVYAYDPDLDLALITPQYLLDEDGNPYGEELTNEETEAIGLPYVDIADYEPSLGDNITIIGYPDATGSENLALTNGVISNFDTFAVEDEIFNYSYTTDAIINPGNSGGPAYNSDEKLIGIAVAVSTEGVGGNYGYIMAGDMIYVWFLTLVEAGYLNQEFVDQTFGNDFVYEEYADIDLSEVIEETGSTTDSDVESTNKTFPDVAQSHQYYNSIMYMVSEKVVNGYPDGTFKPDNPINRAEMMKILVEALIDDAMTSEYMDDTCFPDVPGDQWFTKHVCYGKAFSWVKGYSDNTFRPSQTITFAEALKITFKGFNLPYTETTEPWYNDAATYAEVNNYIPYSIFDYEQPLTRGEMSDLVSRIKIGTTLGEQALYNFTIYGMEGLTPGDTGNPDDPTSYINTGYFNYYDTYLPFDPSSADNYVGAQECPASTNVYRNELYKYEFCYDPAKVQLGTDFDYLITFFFEEGGLVEDYGVPEGYAAFFSNFGMSLEEFEAIIEQPDFETGLNLDNFTNSHDLKGLKLIEGAETIASNLFLFENEEEDAVVEILYTIEEGNINEAMDLIRDTFRFYEAGSNTISTNLVDAQNCPQGTQLYRDEIDKFEFCFTEDGLTHKSDFYGTTISFSPDPDLSEEDPLDGSISSYLSYDLDAAGYLEISEVTEPQNTENFTNPNNIKGVEYDIVDGDSLSHGLIFGDQYKTKVVKMNYNFAEESDIEFMQIIKETFKFL